MSKKLQLAKLSQAVLDLLGTDQPSDFDVETAMILVHRYPSLTARLKKAEKFQGEKRRWIDALETALGRR